MDHIDSRVCQKSIHHLHTPLKHVTHLKDATYLDIKLTPDTNNKRSHILDIIKQLLKRLIYMIDHCSKIMIVRIDLHFPLGYVFNSEIGYMRKYSNLLMRRLQRLDNSTKHKLHSQMYWVCEKTDKCDIPHYHTVVMLNGHAIHNILTIYKLCSDSWRSVLGEAYTDGLVHCVKGSDISEKYCIGEKKYLSLLRFDRDSAAVYQDIRNTISLLSYLGKSWSKYRARYRGRSHGGNAMDAGYIPRIEHVLTRSAGALSLDVVSDVFDLPLVN